jgi:hypothetical protein
MCQYIKQIQLIFLTVTSLLLLVLVSSPAFCGVQKVTEGSGGEHSHFGWDVAVSGRYALISAANESNDIGTSVGAVYAYENIDGEWSMIQKLTAPDASALAYFGHAVAMDSSQVVISAVGSFANGPFSGCAYVYSREGSQWIFQQTIIPDDGAPSARFGQSVDINGDLILVGAHQAFGKAANTGAAYLFRNENGLWEQDAKLVAGDGQSNDFFGWSVALNNKGTALVGAYSAKGKVEKSGAAYLFEREENEWQQAEKLLAEDGGQRDLFGYSLDLTDDFALIGAYQNQSDDKYCGAAYLFQFDGANWEQRHQLHHSQRDDHDYFGIEVCLSDSIAAVSASRNENDEDADEGSVYLFDYDENKWSEKTKLIAEDGAAHDHYGLALALSGPTVLIGARLNDNGALDDGAAYFDSPGILSIVEKPAVLPEKSALYQNYPNPFNPTTTIQFSLNSTQHVSMSVYDINGKLVTKLLNSKMDVGVHDIVFDATQFPSGVYFYKIKAGNFSQMRKMMLIK